MEPDNFREAWVRISRWHRQARGAQAPPTMEALYDMAVYRVELYRCRPTEGLRVSLLVRQDDIEDGIPTEEEVVASLRGMMGGRAGGVVRNERRRLEEMATGGNVQEGTGEDKVGALGDIGTSDVQGRDPTGGARMGDNGTHP